MPTDESATERSGGAAPVQAVRPDRPRRGEEQLPSSSTAIPPGPRLDHGLSHVLGVVLPLGAVMTGLYLWRRNLWFLIITHFLIDLPIILIALGVLPPI